MLWGSYNTFRLVLRDWILYRMLLGIDWDYWVTAHWNFPVYLHLGLIVWVPKDHGYSINLFAHADSRNLADATCFVSTVFESWLFSVRVYLDLVWVPFCIAGPVIWLLLYIYARDKNDLYNSFMSYSLACLINGATVNILKLCAGRPRPDFYYR